MKILIFGTGVIGSTTGWQLQKRNDITHFVRSDKIRDFKLNGIDITCCDLRKKKNRTSTVRYMPDFIDSLNSIDNYDALLVSVKSNQLISVLKEYNEYFKRIPVFIMQNIGLNDYVEIESLLGKNVSFLYPFIMGGGRSGNKIECSVFNSFINSMVIGNLGNAEKQIEKDIFRELKLSNLQPSYSKNIVAYLKLHYVWAACALASYFTGKSYSDFCKISVIQDSYKAMTECFSHFRKEGINSMTIFPYNLYHFPSLLLAVYSKILYKNEAMKIMVEGHIKSSPDEMEVMYNTLYDYCNDSIESMRVFKGYRPFVDDYFRNK
jgi:ketopantoate reductase